MSETARFTVKSRRSLSKEQKSKSRGDGQLLLPFNPEHVMDEWRRLYDWAVLSRKSAALIEAVSCLGQKFSGTLSAYRLAKRPQRREHFYREIIVAFNAMQTFYTGLPDKHRIPLTLDRHNP
jgi:hypothetical protein